MKGREPASALLSTADYRYADRHRDVSAPAGCAVLEDSPSQVYGAALLMRFGSDPIRGSNPRSSAEAAYPARWPSATFATARSIFPGGRPPGPPDVGYADKSWRGSVPSAPPANGQPCLPSLAQRRHCPQYLPGGTTPRTPRCRLRRQGPGSVPSAPPANGRLRRRPSTRGGATRSVHRTIRAASSRARVRGGLRWRVSAGWRLAVSRLARRLRTAPAGSSS